MPSEQNADLLVLTARIVGAYLEKNVLPVAKLPALIAAVNASIRTLDRAVSMGSSHPAPAVDPRKSVHNDYLICLEDGKKFKALKQHLAVRHNLTPDAYRQKWALPDNYPMVAASYAARRSELAKTLEPGKLRRKPAVETALPATVLAPAPDSRGEGVRMDPGAENTINKGV